MLEQILSMIQQVTGLMPRVKDGNRSNPLEYLYTKVSVIEYQLEIDLNSNNQLEIESLATAITEAINDVSDADKTGLGSIELQGGGDFAKDNVITRVMYFRVIDYTKKPAVPIVPSGLLNLDENGLYNVREYENVIVNVSGGVTPPTGTIEIDTNGTYDVTSYATAEVNVPLPEGSTTITANGEYDVTQYETAVVNTPVPEGSLTCTANGTYDCSYKSEVIVDTPVPSGSLSITENNTYDVTSYAQVVVSIPIPPTYEKYKIEAVTGDAIHIDESIPLEGIKAFVWQGKSAASSGSSKPVFGIRNVSLNEEEMYPFGIAASLWSARLGGYSAYYTWDRNNCTIKNYTDKLVVDSRDITLDLMVNAGFNIDLYVIYTL